jgi:regulator of sigma E protease
MTLIYFILILGVTVLIHELGHFIFAKRAGIYVYEFAIGMGPKLFSFKRKNDETTYSIRLVPIGGFCQLAGEEIEEDKDIPAEKRLQSKTWLQRFLTIIAGCTFNFLLAIVLLFVVGLIYGSPELKPYIGKTLDGYPAKAEGMEPGDLILSINGKKVSSSDDVLTYLEINADNHPMKFEVKKANGNIEVYSITPKKEVTDGKTSYKFGLLFTDKVNHGLVASIEFTFGKFIAIFKSMFDVISNLITGNLGLNNLAGPVGIYKIVGQEASAGFENVLYLIAFLSVNIGFVNLLPFPAFDGGRVIFLIIEKIKGSRVNPRVENIIHAVGFVLLIMLMIFITIQDISRL